MKVQDIKNYGLSGRKIELNLMDCIEASMMVANIETTLSAVENYISNNELESHSMFSEVENLLNKSLTFFRKVALRPENMSTIFNEDDEKSESELPRRDFSRKSCETVSVKEYEDD